MCNVSKVEDKPPIVRGNCSKLPQLMEERQWGKLMMAAVCDGMGSKSSEVIRCPKYLTCWQNNLHLVSLSIKPAWCKAVSTWVTWLICSSSVGENTRTSSTYPTAKFLKGRCAYSISLWKTADAFLSPNGIMLNLYKPLVVMIRAGRYTGI